MEEPKFPKNEAARIAALNGLNILDTAAEDRFDRITRIAQRYFNTPIVLVSLIDTDRQWFKSRQGLAVEETPRNRSFCGHAILGDDIFIVPDAPQDARFADNPLVTGAPHIRFYAGAPIHAPGGERVGTLCIIDDKAREFPASEQVVLRDLADTVEAEMERTRLLEAEVETRKLSMVAEYTDNLVVICDAQGLIEWVNDGFEQRTGYRLDDIVGQKPGSFLQGPATDPETVAFMRDRLAQGKGFSTEILNYSKDGPPYWLSLDVRPVYDDSGGLAHFVAIETDITSRRASEVDMGKLAAIVESSNDAIIAKSLDGKITSWNPGAERMFGYPADEAVGRPMAMLMPPDRSDEEPSILARLRRGESIEHFETERIRKDGQPIDVSVTVSPLRDHDGGVIGASTIARDITEGNRQKAALERSNILLDLMQRLQAEFILSSNPAAAFKNLLGEVLDLTESTFGFFGELCQTPSGQPFLKTHGISNISCKDEIQKFHEENALDGLEFFDLDNLFGAVVKTGKVVVSNDPSDDPRSKGAPSGQFDIDTFLGIPFHHGGEIIGMMALANRTEGYTHDLVEYLQPLTNICGGLISTLRSRQLLRDRESRFRAVVDTVVDGIVTIDAEGIVETFNPAAVRIFGYTTTETIGKNVKMLMPEPYHGEHDGYLSNYIKSGDAKIIGTGREVTGRRKDGSTFPMELAVSEMQVGGKRMFTGIVRDITERKQAEKMKNEFISTVSHELRTPLTSIKGSLGLIRSGATGEVPEKLKAMLDIAHNNSDRLVRLINDILDIEKMEAGHIEFRMELLDLRTLLHQAQEENLGYATQHGAIIKLSCAVSEAKVLGDHDRLMQVLANLLSNAAKFSPRNGSIEIHLSEREAGFKVSVTDHGPGIEAAFHDKIFGKFLQADSSDSRQKGGTGLGLNISKGIIERHGGTIGFETRSGKGTTFFFDLPRAAVVATSVREPAQATEKTVVQTRILICENDPDIATLLELMLEQEGYASDTAKTAAEAQEFLRKTRYDAMTLDIGLPDMDGIALFREIRRDPNTADLPIIFVSANASEGATKLKGEAVGVIDWLEKPIDKGRLARDLRRATSLTPDGRTRILHVEDDPDIVEVLASIVGDLAEIVAAVTIAEAKALLRRQSFDLVVLDLSLPDGNGEELFSLLKKDGNPSTPVIVFSAQDVSGDIAKRVQGALVKSKTSNDELLDTIRSWIASKNLPNMLN